MKKLKKKKSSSKLRRNEDNDDQGEQQRQPLPPPTPPTPPAARRASARPPRHQLAASDTFATIPEDGSSPSASPKPARSPARRVASARLTTSASASSSPVRKFYLPSYGQLDARSAPTDPVETPREPAPLPVLSKLVDGEARMRVPSLIEKRLASHPEYEERLASQPTTAASSRKSSSIAAGPTLRLPVEAGRFVTIRASKRKSLPLDAASMRVFKAVAQDVWQLLIKRASRRQLRVLRRVSRRLHALAAHVEEQRALAATPLDAFEQLQPLGRGSFGIVRLVRQRAAPRRYYALKVLPKQLLLAHEQQERIYWEKDVLSALVHPFTVRFYRTYQDTQNLYMLMEYVPGGELFRLLCDYGRFEPDAVRFYAAQIVLVLDYFARLGIMYRDLKPENLLLDARGNLKITDFGFASVCERSHSFLASAEYIAPEMIADIERGYTRAVDMWAYGVLLYELTYGLPPFMGTLEEISRAMFNDTVAYPAVRGVSDAARSLIAGCLERVPSRRLTPAQTMVHPFFADTDFERVYACDYAPPFVPTLQHAGDVSNFECDDAEADEFLQLNDADEIDIKFDEF